MSNFNEETILEQQKKFQELKDQFAKVNALFDAQKKAMNLTDEDVCTLTKILNAPELLAVLEKSKKQVNA